jgi:hypothetical protein
MKPIVPLTPEQKAALEQMLDGRASRLLVPMSLLEPSNTQPIGFPDGSQSLVPPTYADVSGNPSSAGDLYGELQATDPVIAIYELASLNVLLDRLGTDFAFQQAAVTRYVRPEFRSPPPAQPSAPRPNYEFIINRIGAMIALKGIVGAERVGDPASPYEFRTGDLILRANQFVSGTRFDGTVAPQNNADLAAETICTWDLTNPRDIAYETARMCRMLELLDVPDEKATPLKDKLGLITADLRFAGLPIADFLAIVFGIVSLAGSLSPEAVLVNPRSAAIDSRSLLANVKIPQAFLDTFLSKRSVSLSDMTKLVTSGTPWTQEEYARQMEGSTFRTDFLPFRKFPLIAMSETEYVIPNLQFLTELMFSGLFFELYFGFQGDRNLLSSLWGRLFELSIFELLEYFYPPLSGMLQTNIDFDGGEVDAMLDFGDYIIVFEFKYFLLTQDVKYARSGALLEKALRERLFSNQAGKPKAIRQLLASAAAIRSGKLLTLKGRTDSLPREAVIYPVVVVADPALEAPFVNVFCNGLFQSEVGDLEVDRFFAERRGLPTTDLVQKIWDGRHWRILIRPTRFAKAQFQTLPDCKRFVRSRYVECHSNAA